MKKSFALILTVLLLVFLFVGCNSSRIITVEKPQDQASEDSSSGTSTEGSEITVPVLDEMDGDTSKSVTPETEPHTQSSASGTLKVHFIDVGQGDAILIQTPSNNVLIDGGIRGNTVVDYLKAQGITSLDLVIGTHPHTDHIGGLINVLESIPVKEVIDPGVVHTTKTFEDYLTLIDVKDIKFTEGRAGMVRDFGDGAFMSIVHPASSNIANINDNSIVVRLTFDQISFLLTGDVERHGEEQILSRGYDLKSTVLKVGHHGSHSSTSAAFLNAISPAVAVIMVGEGNSYGHPHSETLLRLANANVDIYRTNINGTVVITTNGQTIEVNPKQPYQYNPQKVPEPPIIVDALESGIQDPGIEKININMASLEKLQEIIHIGPVRAQEIIKLRPFKTVDELTKVSGIGPVRLEDIKKQGKACIN
jgi:competence protein ComEC